MPQPLKYQRRDHADIKRACPPQLGRRWPRLTTSYVNTRLQQSAVGWAVIAHCPFHDSDMLRHQKNFVGIGIFYFSSRRKTANVDVALIRRVRTGDKPGLIRNRDTVGQIPLGCTRNGRSRRLRRRIFFRSLRRRWRLIWIVGLRCRFFGRSWITGHMMTHWRLIICT